MTQEFDNILEQHRKARKLTLAQAGGLIGCSGPHLLDIEKGRARNPSAIILNGIVRTYGLTPEVVLGLFDTKNKGQLSETTP